MAHFARLNNNKVEQVVVIGNKDCLDSNGNESESVGVSFCQSLFGKDTTWIQTSYNKNFRVHFAGVGYTYDESLDAFIPPQPKENPSWILNDSTLDWEPPIPCPNDDQQYSWNEETVSWDLIPPPEEPVGVATT